MARLIARLDLKGKSLINTVQLEGLRKIGCPKNAAKQYYEQGVDELIVMDLVASLYKRNNLVEVIENITNNIFVPVTVGGGIRSVEDVEKLLNCGADKVAVNSAALRRPSLLKEISSKYGSQCLVLSVEAKASGYGDWEIFIDGGREASGVLVCDWICQAEDLGVGEILLTSVDREGSRQGYDLGLLEAVLTRSRTPVTISGGFGKLEHLEPTILKESSGLAFADCLHTGRVTVDKIRKQMQSLGYDVRPF